MSKQWYTLREMAYQNRLYASAMKWGEGNPKRGTLEDFDINYALRTAGVLELYADFLERKVSYSTPPLCPDCDCEMVFERDGEEGGTGTGYSLVCSKDKSHWRSPSYTLTRDAEAVARQERKRRKEAK